MHFASDPSLFFRRFSVSHLGMNVNIEDVHHGEEGGTDKLSMAL